jgi:peptidoglycan/xylan/chitin deacetylase (PgdA/CDA1 family)
MRVTLSFDNGPDPDVTPQILDVLRRNDVRAWFFVLGKHVASPSGAELVARAVAEGHRVGNHSFSHSTPLGEDLRPDAVEQEIVATDRLLAPLVPGPRHFRPFGGGGLLGRHLLSPRALAHLVDERFSCVLWNSVPRDWLEPASWDVRALEDCGHQPETLVVLHDIPGACLERLEAFIDAIRARGGDFSLDLPASCVPLVAGVAVADLTPFVSSVLAP